MKPQRRKLVTFATEGGGESVWSAGGAPTEDGYNVLVSIVQYKRECVDAPRGQLTTTAPLVVARLCCRPVSGVRYQSDAAP